MPTDISPEWQRICSIEDDLARRTEADLYVHNLECRIQDLRTTIENDKVEIKKQVIEEIMSKEPLSTWLCAHDQETLEM